MITSPSDLLHGCLSGSLLASRPTSEKEVAALLFFLPFPAVLRSAGSTPAEACVLLLLFNFICMTVGSRGSHQDQHLRTESSFITVGTSLTMFACMEICPIKDSLVVLTKQAVASPVANQRREEMDETSLALKTLQEGAVASRGEKIPLALGLDLSVWVELTAGLRWARTVLSFPRGGIVQWLGQGPGRPRFNSVLFYRLPV